MSLLEKLKKNQALKAQQEARLPLKQRLLNLATSGSKDSITDYLQEDLISTGKTAGEVQAELSLPENQEFINRISKAKGEAEVKTLLKNLRAGKKVAAGVGEGYFGASEKAINLAKDVEASPISKAFTKLPYLSALISGGMAARDLKNDNKVAAGIDVLEGAMGLGGPFMSGLSAPLELLRPESTASEEEETKELDERRFKQIQNMLRRKGISSEEFEK